MPVVAFEGFDPETTSFYYSMCKPISLPNLAIRFECFLFCPLFKSGSCLQWGCGTWEIINLSPSYVNRTFLANQSRYKLCNLVHCPEVLDRDLAAVYCSDLQPNADHHFYFPKCTNHAQSNDLTIESVLIHARWITLAESQWDVVK